jgi:hypothetical protein
MKTILSFMLLVAAQAITAQTFTHKIKYFHNNEEITITSLEASAVSRLNTVPVTVKDNSIIAPALQRPYTLNLVINGKKFMFNKFKNVMDHDSEIEVYDIDSQDALVKIPNSENTYAAGNYTILINDKNRDKKLNGIVVHYNEDVNGVPTSIQEGLVTDAY